MKHSMFLIFWIDQVTSAKNCVKQSLLLLLFLLLLFFFFLKKSFFFVLKFCFKFVELFNKISFSIIKIDDWLWNKIFWKELVCSQFFASRMEVHSVVDRITSPLAISIEDPISRFISSSPFKECLLLQVIRNGVQVL